MGRHRAARTKVDSRAGSGDRLWAAVRGLDELEQLLNTLGRVYQRRGDDGRAGQCFERARAANLRTLRVRKAADAYGTD